MSPVPHGCDDEGVQHLPERRNRRWHDGGDGFTHQVVGGSIAGCAMAIAGARAGANVTVHERSDGALQDRGFGIVIPPPLHRELVTAGYLGADMPTTPVATRVWLARAPGRRSARELARQQAPVTPCNWGLLWRALRSNIGGSAYHRGRPVDSVGRTSCGGALIRTADGEREYDIVVGADGHRSVTRELIAPGVRPAPAGYLVWRGTIPSDALRDHPEQLDLLETVWITLGFPGGHGVFYLIPGRNRSRGCWRTPSTRPPRHRQGPMTGSPPGTCGTSPRSTSPPSGPMSSPGASTPHRRSTRSPTSWCPGRRNRPSCWPVTRRA